MTLRPYSIPPVLRPTRLTWISGTVQADAALLGLDRVTSYFSSENLPVGLGLLEDLRDYLANRILNIIKYRISSSCKKRNISSLLAVA